MEPQCDDPLNRASTQRREPPASPSTHGVVGSRFAIAFSDKRDVVTIPHHPALVLTNAVTVSCWVYFEKDSTGYIVVKKQSFAIAVKKQTIMISLNNEKPSWVWKNTKFSVDLRTWHHIALTYDKTMAEALVYVDGQVVRAFVDMEGPLDTSSENDLHFGLYLAEEHIMGMITDVRIWRRALTLEEIQQSMLSPPDTDDADLVGWWPLNTGYGFEVHDLSNNKLHGELSGARWEARREPNAYPSTLRQDLLRMFNNPIGHDIRLRVAERESQPPVMQLNKNASEDKINATDDPYISISNEQTHTDNVIYAHKIFLTQRCRVFQAMLKPEMKEGNCEEIVLQDISFNALKKLVEFIYTDHTDIDGDCVLELFQAADKYDLPRLKHMCEQFMLDNINTDNVCMILEVADQYNSLVLRGVCMRYILSNFGVILQSDAYLNLGKHLQKEINIAAAREHFSPPAKRQKLNNAAPS